MRSVFILTTAFICCAHAAPQIQFSLGSWGVPGNPSDQFQRLGQAVFGRHPGRNIGIARNVFPQIVQPDHHFQGQQQVNKNDQGRWGMCWYPANSAADNNLSKKGPSPPQFPNPGTHRRPHNVDEFLGNLRIPGLASHNRGNRPAPPPPHFNHHHGHGPPPPPHHHHHGHHPPPPPPPHHHHHHPPHHRGPPPNQPHDEMERCEERTEESISTLKPFETFTPIPGSDIDSTQSSAPILITSENPTSNKNEESTVTADNSIQSTTEFDWNNYYVDGSMNPEGIGLLDIRSGGLVAN